MIPARRAPTTTPSHAAIATHTPPLSCTTARSSSTAAQAAARNSQTHAFTAPFHTTYAATASVTTTSSTNAVPAIAPATSQPTVAAMAPASPPRRAAATVLAARWRRVRVGGDGARTLMSLLKVPLRRNELSARALEGGAQPAHVTPPALQ